DPKFLGRIGFKTIVYYLSTTGMAIIIGLGIAFMISPGKGLSLDVSSTDKVEVEESEGVVQTFLNIVPENPFEALTQGEILQIIFFAIFLGLAISLIGEKGKPVKRFFDSLAEIMFWITGVIMRFAPIGVLGLIAPIIGEYGASILLPLLKIIIAVAIACILHAIIVYSSAVKLFAKMSPLKFFKGIASAAAVAFSTASSAGTLPVTPLDETPILSPMEKVRSVFLNALHVERGLDSIFSEHQESAGMNQPKQQLSQQELFKGFYKEVKGKEPDEETEKIFQEVLSDL